MNFLRKPWIQKITATIFVALLVFIHAAKAFHTHNPVYAAQNDGFSKATALLRTNFTCAICDFQLAKDADVTVSLPQFQLPVSLIEANHYYIPQQPISFSIASSVRGPPDQSC